MGFICYRMIQMMEPLETAELLAFVKTVEARSLSRAAVELEIPRATLGRRLARLEERLGVRLIRRTTRRMALTEAGEALLHEARVVLDATARAEAVVRRGGEELVGELKVSAPPGFDTNFADVICDFAAQHPKVRLQMHFSTAHVDMVRDGFDVAIRASAALTPGLVARTLLRVRVSAVASPSYLAAHSTPRRARDLERHRVLMGFARGETPAVHWPVGKRNLRLKGAFSSNELQLLRRAALRGLGIALLPVSFTKDDVAQGTLVKVLDGVVGTESRLAIVYPEREAIQPHVRAFVDAVVAGARKFLPE